MKIEYRNDSVIVSGYVNAVERRSRVLKDSVTGQPFVEIMRAGTFRRALERDSPVELKFNHQRGIGKTGANLTLREDVIGLHAEANISDPEVMNAARAGKLTGWSFGFYPEHQQKIPGDSGEPELRLVDDIDLIEVSLLTVTPAYIATSVEVRSKQPEEGKTPCQLRFSEESPVCTEVSRQLAELELELLDMNKNKEE